ncbi:lipase [Plectosphaerella cucumerina]|uniref:Carboxylic ester hydrolase n=1 Tax=Plectosphaerella cucumerina TaxID=40658 RepID=A0A8K0TRV2_9PEZI|nr:lipase [Plectosphaerella cucumerina]
MSRLLALALPLLSCLVGVLGDAPAAHTRNGTYRGVHLPSWEQDAFLGVPYAQPPTGNNRFRWPQSLNESFEGTRDATTQGYSCMQYRGNFNMSEDCLNLNVVRPAGHSTNESLPVLVWIFGGGLYTGSVADPQYNLSGIVRVSQDMGRPVIAVAMNYRLNMYGFLQTPQLLLEGSSNAGLLDQRMALRWVQENIAAFGGDPDRVVVWGESAGAQSIAYHLFSNDGRDDGLFRGAIMESGGPTGAQVQALPYYAVAAENLTRTVGCWDARDQLACLRGLSQADLYAAQPSQVWNPLIDSDFLTGYPSQLMAAGRFNRVPLLIGANTDEGINFRPTTPRPETERDLLRAFASWRSYALSPPTIRRLLDLYPDDPCDAPPYAVANCSRLESLNRGAQWRRGASIGGDMVMIAGRRRMCELYAGEDVPVYSYRFDQRLWNRRDHEGIQHFDNVAFSFQNISGLLGPSPTYDSHVKLAKVVGRAYIRFVYGLDPNRGEEETGCNGPLPAWPRYDLGEPKNMVLSAEKCYLEDDTYRREGMAYLNSPEVARELLS